MAQRTVSTKGTVLHRKQIDRLEIVERDLVLPETRLTQTFVAVSLEMRRQRISTFARTLGTLVPRSQLLCPRLVQLALESRNVGVETMDVLLLAMIVMYQLEHASLQGVVPGPALDVTLELPYLCRDAQRARVLPAVHVILGTSRSVAASIHPQLRLLDVACAFALFAGGGMASTKKTLGRRRRRRP